LVPDVYQKGIARSKAPVELPSLAELAQGVPLAALEPRDARRAARGGFERGASKNVDA
jgi:hypothetical protein